MPKSRGNAKRIAFAPRRGTIMQYLLLAVTTVCLSAQQLIQKRYNQKTENPNQFLFLAFTALAATAFFIAASLFRLSFDPAVLPYSLGFAAAYIAATVGLIYALKLGSMAITALVNSYSLLIPTFYGIIFLRESAKVAGIIGITLLLVSLFLLGAKKERATGGVKWLVFLVVAFVGNGMCSTVQKIQQTSMDGAYKNEFMIFALIAAFAVFTGLALARGDMKNNLTPCAGFGSLNGVFNGAVNFLVLILTGLIPNSVLFPCISAGSIVLSLFTALFLFKEKLSAFQIVGYALGLASVILLNI